MSQSIYHFILPNSNKISNVWDKDLETVSAAIDLNAIMKLVAGDHLKEEKHTMHPFKSKKGRKKERNE